MTARSCAAPAGATASNMDVVCSFAPTFTQAQIASATLGTVRRGAVTNGGATPSATNLNPIGAEFTTGGTGNPTR